MVMAGRIGGGCMSFATLGGDLPGGGEGHAIGFLNRWRNQWHTRRRKEHLESGPSSALCILIAIKSVLAQPARRVQPDRLPSMPRLPLAAEGQRSKARQQQKERPVAPAGIGRGRQGSGNLCVQNTNRAERQ